jgi:hypothetical protein
VLLLVEKVEQGVVFAEPNAFNAHNATRWSLIWVVGVGLTATATAAAAATAAATATVATATAAAAAGLVGRTATASRQYSLKAPDAVDLNVSSSSHNAQYGLLRRKRGERKMVGKCKWTGREREKEREV